MNNKKVLISGAGIGGLTLAYFLNNKGFTPIIIEKADSLRDNGYMIDFFSSGISVAEEMGIIPDLEAKSLPFNYLNQSKEKGKKSLTLNMSGFRKTLAGKLFNFTRTDLVATLYEKIKNDVEIRFSYSIQHIEQSKSGVKVSFDNGTEEVFDILIGADGLNSNVRNLLYSQGEVEKKYLGYYVCGLEHQIPLKLKRDELLYMICPRKQVMSYKASNAVSNSLFVFKSPTVLKHMPTEEVVALLKKEFAQFISPVPEIIEEASKQEKLFFDQVSQIRIHSSWHKGRVCLLGDSAYCITLLSGQGASMAMTGAYVLSEKLIKYNGDYESSFSEYESDLRPKIEKMQKKAVKNAATYLPSTKIALWLRNLFAPLIFTKIFSPFLIKQIGADNYFDTKQP